MKVKIITYFAIALTIGLALSSCDKTKIVDPGEQENIPIRWDIHSGKQQKPATKALIYSDEELQNNCTSVAEGGLGEGIGFWADTHQLENGNISIYKNVFGADQTRLIYYPNSTETVKWDYDATDLFWSIGSRYVVRAFYPQTLNANIVHASTNADLFVLEYNSHITQEDLMVAFNEVHTKDPITGKPSVALTVEKNLEDKYVEEPSSDTGTGTGTEYHQDWRGYSQPFDLNDPIPLYFRHTLAAVRFRFTFSYEDQDELLSCNLANIKEYGGFHTVGVLLYGDYAASNTLQGKRNFKWETYQTSFDNIPFFTWEVQDGVQGSPISRSNSGYTITERMAVAFSEKDRYILRISNDNNSNNIVESGEIQSETEYEGTRALPVKKIQRPFYNENEGWLLIIPQENGAEVALEYTTKKLGKKRVVLPTFTGTLADGTEAPESNPNARYFVAGRRYTYTIVIKHTNVEIVTTVEPWSDIYSSHDIFF